MTAAVVADGRIELGHLTLHFLDRQLGQLGIGLDLGVQVIDVGCMMPAMMDLHRGLIDMRFERRAGVG
jgi:hypothetical protein